MEGKKILVLAPHTDDGELGCGATIAKYLREGKEIYYIAFSSCEESLPAGAQPGALIHELTEATRVLGIPKEHVLVLNYPVRHFGEHRQAILDDMIRLGKQIQPDLVFMPSQNDIHQDHHVIAMEGLRAFKKTRILAYEVPWNNYVFHNQCFSCVEEEDVRKKMDAIACYESQRGRDYATPEFTRALLLTHGVQIGSQYAEVFEIPRWIM